MTVIVDKKSKLAKVRPEVPRSGKVVVGIFFMGDVCTLAHEGQEMSILFSNNEVLNF